MINPVEKYDALMPFKHDMLLSDLDHDELIKFGEHNGINYLGNGSFCSPSFPVLGNIHGPKDRFIINLLCQSCHKPNAPIINVLFLLDTGSPISFLSIETISTLLYGSPDTGGAIPDSLKVKIQDPDLQLECKPSKEFFFGINVLGMNQLRALEVTIEEMNWTTNTFCLDRVGHKSKIESRTQSGSQKQSISDESQNFSSKDAKTSPSKTTSHKSIAYGGIKRSRTDVDQLSHSITIHSLNAEQQELERYERALEDGRKTGLLKYLYMALAVGINNIIMHFSYAVAFWYASRLVLWYSDFDRGAVFTFFFALMSGSTALGGALPQLVNITSAKGAARHVFRIINRKPHIDPYSNEGHILWEVKGAIRFQDVNFTYPLRKDVKVLKGVTFSLEPGKKLALVGASGCGKSTIVNLLLRFYDPIKGTVLLDDHDLRKLNVRWLRDQIGVVSQEPILFDGTLEENIMLGNENATKEQLLECCRLANAFEFIQKLSDGLRTRVGERGAQLSGGQRQRIAIARALIKNPKVLLLDEATSALDTESEALVQRALNKAQEGRTTIIVAHRLSTIRDVDQILVFKEGRIVEVGTHTKLYNEHGIFYGMVNQQQIHKREAERALGIVDEENGSTKNEDEQTDKIETVAQTDKQPLLLTSGGSLRSLKGASSVPSRTTSHKSISSPGPLKGLKRRTSETSVGFLDVERLQ